jgi:hypothetical protein
MASAATGLSKEILTLCPPPPPPPPSPLNFGSHANQSILPMLNGIHKINEGRFRMMASTFHGSIRQNVTQRKTMSCLDMPTLGSVLRTEGLVGFCSLSSSSEVPNGRSRGAIENCVTRHESSILVVENGRFLLASPDGESLRVLSDNKENAYKLRVHETENKLSGRATYYPTIVSGRPGSRVLSQEQAPVRDVISGRVRFLEPELMSEIPSSPSASLESWDPKVQETGPLKRMIRQAKSQDHDRRRRLRNRHV